MAEVKPLNAKLLAEGEAVLLATPGKPMNTLPFDGIVVCVVNWTVCAAGVAG